MSFFKPAARQQRKLRMALAGPSGSGKTYTALRIAMGLAPGGRIGVLDTEHGSAALYAGEDVEEGRVEFGHAPLTDYSPASFERAFREAAAANLDVLIVDSYSHAWEGMLAEVDRIAAGTRSRDSFGAWRKVTPMQQEQIGALLRMPCHVIVTLRTKTEYEITKDNQGKNKVEKVGTTPKQRDGLEYEFDVVGDLDIDANRLIIGKTRCSALNGKAFTRAGGDVAKILAAWLNTGEAAPVVASAPKAAAEASPADSKGYHPEFMEIRAAFMGNLGKRGVKYDDLAAWTEETEGQRPSAWGKERLRALLADMAEGQPGRVALDEWLHDRAERAAIQGEGA